MRRVCMIVGLLLPLACGGEGQAREQLEKDGYSEIELKPDGDGFAFTAKKGSQSCSGTIKVEKGVGSSSFSHSASCR